MRIGSALDLPLPLGAVLDTVVVIEDLGAGQLIAAYTLELCTNATACTRLSALGGTVGQKVIDCIGRQVINATGALLRFTPTKAAIPGYESVWVASLHASLVALPPTTTHDGSPVQEVSGENKIV